MPHNVCPTALPLPRCQRPTFGNPQLMQSRIGPFSSAAPRSYLGLHCIALLRHNYLATHGFPDQCTVLAVLRAAPHRCKQCTSGTHRLRSAFLGNHTSRLYFGGDWILSMILRGASGCCRVTPCCRPRARLRTRSRSSARRERAPPLPPPCPPPRSVSDIRGVALPRPRGSPAAAGRRSPAGLSEETAKGLGPYCPVETTALAASPAGRAPGPTPGGPRRRFAGGGAAHSGLTAGTA